MIVNPCVQCNQRESMRQTDLCEDCLIQSFKPLISLSDKIRSFHANKEGSLIHDKPKGAA
ncbi:hypothetical protein [Leptospira alstonii]|nr:hypothetical protein [Leptospira alstonii]